MACYYPKTAYRLENGQVSFLDRGKVKSSLIIPCGGCIGCRLERQKAWAIRIKNESSLYDKNAFVTLTYNEETNPTDLLYTHFQKFLKRLRKRYDAKLRFFVAGEYGANENTKRPHWHVILFNYWPKDARLIAPNYYDSQELNDTWAKGFVNVGLVTDQSANYVAKYCVKKSTGELSQHTYTLCDPRTGEIKNLTPEFARMSLKPGIGKLWFDKYKTDLYPKGVYTKKGGIIDKIPRYYENKFKELNPLEMEQLQYDRYLKSNPENSTPERLAVRESVQLAKVNFYKKRKL